MIGGWFVGDFAPVVLATDQFEVAVKYYQAGQREPVHHHKIAEEITVIARGRVRMCQREWNSGSIVHLSAGESTDFEALEDTITVVVKRPSVPDDKYLDNPTATDTVPVASTSR
jgi:quercetin dioxygenase-like cupin family protein